MYIRLQITIIKNYIYDLKVYGISKSSKSKICSHPVIIYQPNYLLLLNYSV